MPAQIRSFKDNTQEKINYLGKRVKRGLFKSSTGKFINADVNGALVFAEKYSLML